MVVYIALKCSELFITWNAAPHYYGRRTASHAMTSASKQRPFLFADDYPLGSAFIQCGSSADLLNVRCLFSITLNGKKLTCGLLFMFESALVKTWHVFLCLLSKLMNKYFQMYLHETCLYTSLYAFVLPFDLMWNLYRTNITTHFCTVKKLKIEVWW